MLYGILYVSEVTNALSDKEIEDISSISHSNNSRDQVSGALLYMGGEFLQILEGDEHKLMQTYRRIDADTRHHSTNLLFYGPIKSRNFKTWEMKHSQVDIEKFRQRTGLKSLKDFFQRSSEDKFMEMGIMLFKEFSTVVSD